MIFLSNFVLKVTTNPFGWSMSVLAGRVRYEALSILVTAQAPEVSYTGDRSNNKYAS